MKLGSLATQLRLTFGLYLVLLAAVLASHVRASQDAAQRARDLSALGERQRVVAHDQVRRLAEMQRSLEKFAVTRDAAYFERAFSLTRDFARAQEVVRSSALTGQEKAAADRLLDSWTLVEQTLDRLADSLGTTTGGARQAALALSASLEETTLRAQELASSIEGASEASLAEARLAARRAERVALVIATIAFFSSALLSIALVRAILRPLERLAGGTRELAGGRFDHRLSESGPTEFAALSRDFNAMAARLAELDGLKRDFISTVSHDLKTPLSSMQETVEVMLEELPGPITPRQRKLLELNRESARRLAQMLAKLLDLSRLEAETTPRRDVIDLSATVRDVVDRLGVTRPGRGPSIALIAPAMPLWIRANEQGIAQVLENLLENAIKFSPSAGTVRIAVADLPANGTVLLSVADEGPGVPDAEKDRVFERFHQTSSGRSVGNRGVGLGLAICRHIVDAHGGMIWVADHEPRGAVFCVLLPGPSVRVESAA